MIKILDLYIGRTLLSTTTIALLVLVGLSSLISFVDQMRNVGRGSFDMVVAGIYVMLSVPREIEQFFPMATLIGGLIGMGMLASSSELVVMQAAGRSRFNIVISCMKSALIMVLVVMAVGEWIAPVSERHAKELKTQAISDGALFSKNRKVWAKDGEDFVSIGEVSRKDLLIDVSIFRFDDDLNLKRVIHAQQANYMGEGWQLNQVTDTHLNPQRIQVEKQDTDKWHSSLTPEKLGVVTVKPEALSITGLLEYITYLQNNQQDSDRYQLALWRKIMQPLTIAVMLLVALSYVFGPLRSVTMGARVIMGVLTGFGFFIVDQVFGNMALVYQLPSIVGATLPACLFAGLAMFLLRR